MYMPGISYKIVYSKRRTLALMVNQSAELVIKAPQRMPVSVIERFVREKQGWIKKSMEKQGARKKKEKRFEEGERFLYLGKEYPLFFIPGYASSLKFEDGFYLSRNKQPFAKKYFEDFYKKQAKSVFLGRLKLYGLAMNAEYAFGKVTGANTRWGSCSHKNTINFTWKLIMAPQEVIDYVVVHELAHTAHKNHSARFWAHVGKYCPEYGKLRLWLQENGHKLAL
jgi:predicted metal-dependent hydrolase